MRIINRILLTAAVAAATTSCGDVVRSGKAPVMLVINSLGGAAGTAGAAPSIFGGFLNSDVLNMVTSPAPCTPTSPCPTTFNDVGQVVLSLVLKDIGLPGASPTPTSNNAVTIMRYNVTYLRSDGRNTAGVDVPYPVNGAITATVLGTSPTTLVFELVTHAAKAEAPLVQLINSPNVLSTTAQVTFYGTDQVGNAISVTGQIQIEFANFGG